MYLLLTILACVTTLFTNMYRTEDSDITKKREDTGLIDFLKVLPPVEFCCIYGSTLHPNNHDKVLFGFFFSPNFFRRVLFHTCNCNVFVLD